MKSVPKLSAGACVAVASEDYYAFPHPDCGVACVCVCVWVYVCMCVCVCVLIMCVMRASVEVPK